MANVLRPILRQAFFHPRRTAVVDDMRTWRYLDLLGGAYHLAAHLKKTTQRERIGLLLPTSGAFPLAALAIWLLNRTVVPINYLLSPGEQQYIIDDSEIDTLVTVGPMLDALGLKPQNVQLVELDKLRGQFKGIPPFFWPPRPADDSLAVILYTSGTSGKPKGVMLSHHNLASDIANSCTHMELTSADCFLGVLPQFHSFGLTALTLIPLTIGAKVVYTARFIPRKIVQLIREHHPDIFMAIPSMYNAMLTVKDTKPEDFSSIRLALSGGEPLPRVVAENVMSRLGIEIREGYGLTETSPVIAVNTPRHTRHGSVGRLIPQSSARIVSDDGRDLPAGEEGEILLAGPNIMKGYFKLPDLTAQVMDDKGYFRSGDWGKLDAEGYLYITGRKKEMLIIGGENVFPREIEEVLNRHPAVKDSAVVGRHDPMRGEEPIAFVELHENAAIDPQEVRNFCRQHIAGFKVPREVRVLGALPRNATGKIMRRNLPKD